MATITDNVTDTVKNAVQGVTSTPGRRAQPGQQPSTGPTSTLGSGRQPGQQVSIGAISPTTGASGRTPEDQDDAGLVPADTYPIGAVPDVVPPVTNVIASVTEVVPPVTNVIAPVNGVVAPVIDVVTPVTDVIAPGQDMLTSVLDAVVPPTQPPSELSSFLLGIAGMVPAENGAGGIHGPRVAAAGGALRASPMPLGPSIAGIPGEPVAGNATRVATLDVTTLSRVSALSGMPPVAPDAAFPMSAESFSRMS